MANHIPTLVLQEAFTTAVAAAVPAWETIASSYSPGLGGLRAFDASQGKTSDLDRDAAGVASFLVDVRDRALDPSNTAGAHYPYVTPNRPVRLAFGYVAEVLKDNPRSYWRMSEPPEAVYARDDQRSTTGTAVNTPTSGVTGLLDGDHAWSFASVSSQYVDTGDLSLFEAGDCTYELWINASSAGADRTGFSEGASGGSSPYVNIRLDNTHVAQIGVRNNAAAGGEVTGSTVVDNGEWHYLVLTKSGTTVRLYVDGATEGTPLTVSGAFTLNKSTIGTLGRNTNSEYFDGTIDHVAVYSSALSATRIAAHYAAGATRIGGYVHSGYTDAHNITYSKPNDATVTIPSTDRFKLLARAKLTGWGTQGEQTASARILYTLGQVGYDFRYFIGTSSAVTMEEDPSDQFALDHILDMTDTENSRCFIDKDGLFRFVSRNELNNNAFYNTSQATFTDTGAANGIPYTTIVFENSDTLLRNSVEIDHPTFDPITVTDATSITRNGTMTYQRTVRDASIAGQNATAEAILAQYKDPQTRVLSVTVPTSRATASYPYGLYGVVGNLQLGMRVTIVRTPPGGGAAISQECFILSQANQCDAATQNWTTTFGFTLAPAANVYGVWDTAVWDTGKWGY